MGTGGEGTEVVEGLETDHYGEGGDDRRPRRGVRQIFDIHGPIMTLHDGGCASLFSL